MIPLRDINPVATRPVVTYGLLAVNLLAFAYQVALSPLAAKQLVERFGLVPYFLAEDFHAASLGTVFTSMFLHSDVVHLLSNLWFLYVFGDNVEDALGRARFLLFYLACGICAAAGQLYVDPTSRIPMIGASGAISGVLGAYFRLFPRARVIALIPVLIIMLVREAPAWMFIVVWFGLQLLQGLGSLGSLAQGGVAFFAHIGGFVGGLLLIGLFGRTRSAHLDAAQRHASERPGYGRYRRDRYED